MPYTKILRSINRTIGTLYILQLTLSLGVVKYMGVDISSTINDRYLLFLSVLHIGLWIFLSLVHDHFQLIPTGEKLHRINLANKITLFRISSTPLVGFLLYLLPKHNVLFLLIPLILIVFLSDLFDGAIARGNRQITKVGKYLDSISDYSILIVVTVVFATYKMMPNWLFLLILFRYLFQAIGMLALLIYQGYVHPIATLLGKTSVFSTMLLFSVEILGRINPLKNYFQLFLPLLEGLVAAVLLVSLIEKIVHLKRGFIEAKEYRKHIKEIKKDPHEI
ncbi:MAG: CDP-alcohol phosphatidyltransferase family protein [Spirochaetales bacterium]